MLLYFTIMRHTVLVLLAPCRIRLVCIIFIVFLITVTLQLHVNIPEDYLVATITEVFCISLKLSGLVGMFTVYTKFFIQQ
jgi:hypothetical protein